MIVPIKDKQIRLSRIGHDKNILVNHSTGEVQGTHITTFKKVDGAQFVKLFTANIGLTFDFSAAGIKSFGVLLWVVQNSALSKDEVDMDSFALEDFLAAQAIHNEQPLRLSLATFKRGINEMEKAQIVAKTVRQGRYFINPNFVFNGDRIAFTTVIERKKKTSQEQLEEAGQQRLIDN